MAYFLSKLSQSSLRQSQRSLFRAKPSFGACPISKKNVNNRLWYADSSRTFSHKSDTEISEFLKEEITVEKNNHKSISILNGYEVTKDGAELVFTRRLNSEKIVISLNVNHTVDSIVPDDGSQEAPEMKSKPDFEVDIIKAGEKTLSFSCSYIPNSELEGSQQTEDGQIEDVFAIDEVTMYTDPNDKNYAVAGDILDGYLYDLFMNMLDERGINGEFAQKLSDFCSSYEHSLYIQLLEDLNKFIER